MEGKRSRKRFTELLPAVLITEKQKTGVHAQADEHSWTVSDVVRAAIDFYLEAHPIEELDLRSDQVTGS